MSGWIEAAYWNDCIDDGTAGETGDRFYGCDGAVIVELSLLDDARCRFRSVCLDAPSADAP